MIRVLLIAEESRTSRDRESVLVVEAIKIMKIRGVDYYN